MNDIGRDFGTKIKENMETFIPKGLTTGCKKSTKQAIELGEFSLLWFPQSASLYYVRASRFPYSCFLKNNEGFFYPLHHYCGLAPEAESGIQGSKSTRYGERVD